MSYVNQKKAKRKCETAAPVDWYIEVGFMFIIELHFDMKTRSNKSLKQVL